ncbi:MAG: hypothetical protein ABIM19_09510, partial [candidate division WOR-3 bacterium]
ALLLLNPENERILDDFCDSIKKLCESGIKNLEKHKITELVDALEKIETPTSEEKPRVPAESKETEVVAGEWPQNLEILIGKSPPGSILIGNEKYQIRSWRDILLSTAEWLIRKGHITEPFKLKGSRKLYVVNSEPKQPDSKDKRMGKSLFIRLSNGLYLWAKLNSADCVLWSFYLLEHFGYTPGHAYLKPPADWKS